MNKSVKLQILYATMGVIIALILMLVGLIMPFSWIKVVVSILLACGLAVVLFFGLLTKQKSKN